MIRAIAFTLALSFVSLANAQDTHVPLSSLDLSKMTAGWGEPQADKNCMGQPMSIAGRTFEHGVGTHADSLLHVELDGKASRVHRPGRRGRSNRRARHDLLSGIRRREEGVRQRVDEGGRPGEAGGRAARRRAASAAHRQFRPGTASAMIMRTGRRLNLIFRGVKARGHRMRRRVNGREGDPHAEAGARTSHQWAAAVRRSPGASVPLPDPLHRQSADGVRRGEAFRKD